MPQECGIKFTAESRRRLRLTLARVLETFFNTWCLICTQEGFPRVHLRINFAMRVDEKV